MVVLEVQKSETYDPLSNEVIGFTPNVNYSGSMGDLHHEAYYTSNEDFKSTYLLGSTSFSH